MLRKILIALNGRGYFKKLPDCILLHILYYARKGTLLNLKHPRTFSEKLQWLKLYDRRPEYSLMVDKYEAKKYVTQYIDDTYIIPTYGVWDSYDEITFDELPDSFILKCTHDSGGLVICKNKENFNSAKARDKLEECLKRRYYEYSREWPYKNVRPRIIAEKYLEDPDHPEGIQDYKLFCFNGKVKFFKIDFDRFIEHHANYYDLDGNILPFGEALFPPIPERKLHMPINLELMVKLAEKIAADRHFLRVDFYEVNGKVYFGEMTFFPAGGLTPLTIEEWDIKLGSMLKLPID